MCLAVSVIGFWPTYFGPVIAGRYEAATPLMPLHVLTVAIWILFIVAQPAFVVSGRIQQHRRNGVVGAVIALGVVVTGTSVQIEAMTQYAQLDDPANAVVTPFLRLVALYIFAFAVWAAFIYRARTDWHKRLMMLGTFALLEAPFSRFYGQLFGLGENANFAAAISHTVIMIAFLAWDRIAMGRFHPASLWGTIVITVIVFGTAPLAASDWWATVAARLAA